MKTIDEYRRVFEAECRVTYPSMDAYEAEMGYALPRAGLEEAARTLACPIKSNPPSWQHGRLIYSTLRKYLETKPERVLCLDIGTAKGFSALCAAFALVDGHNGGHVVSVDVIDPNARIARNSVADLSGLKTVRELVCQWIDAQQITFLQASGTEWLSRNKERVHFAFIDGKHNYAAVSEESRLLSQVQEPGDVIIFDDLQYPGIEQAVAELAGYEVRRIQSLPSRRYAIATRL